MKISSSTKQLIIEKVIISSYISQIEYDLFSMFIGSILDLENMPSEDPRYKTASQDMYQHMANNDDWDLMYLFTKRFPFLNDDNIFEKLLNNLVAPEYCTKDDEINRLVLQINRYLEKENYEYKIEDFTDNQSPIYKIVVKSKNNISRSHQANRIPIYVNFHPNAIHYFNNTHPKPPVFPSFNLVSNIAWNDFGLVSEFYLFYFDSDKTEYPIGNIKIITEQITNAEKLTTLEGYLDTTFNELSDEFCSLGQSFDYYRILKEKLGSNFENFLWAMKDCSFFSVLHEKFENHPYFKSSLIRNDKQEQVLREAKFRTYGLDSLNLYSFTYNFNPKFSKKNYPIELNFSNVEYYFNRIYGVIGKNGTGKTQFISSLPLDISKNNSEKFIPSTPQFSKVIAVSYSAFDNFEIPKSSANFNYVFCGLKNTEGVQLSEKGLVNRFHASWKKIKISGRFGKWKKLLSNFIEDDLLESMFSVDGETVEELNIIAFKEVRKILSSGQSLLLYIITEIVANIRYNSLLLYDEPETHLHPNAISQLFNTVFELLEEFDSYCIMTTHSPLIIRELVSKNVYVFTRDREYFNVTKLPIETYGENLTTLTNEVFGNRAMPHQYKTTLAKLVAENKSYEEIKNILTSANLPLSINTSIYLENLLDEKE